MTVKELIKELEKANQNAKVIIVDDCRYEKDLIDVEVYNDDVIYILKNVKMIIEKQIALVCGMSLVLRHEVSEDNII